MYAYVGNNPISGVDPSGLEVRVYGYKTFWGIAGAQHVFVYSTEAKEGTGRNGSSGFAVLEGPGYDSNFNPATTDFAYTVVQPDANGLYNGRTEKEFIDFIKKRINNGITYIPGKTDCHSSLAQAFQDAGVAYPGAPYGRSAWDEYAADFFAEASDNLLGPVRRAATTFRTIQRLIEIPLGFFD